MKSIDTFGNGIIYMMLFNCSICLSLRRYVVFHIFMTTRQIFITFLTKDGSYTNNTFSDNDKRHLTQDTEY